MPLCVVTPLILTFVLLTLPCLVNAKDETIPQILQDCYNGKPIGSQHSKKSCLQKYMDHAFGDLSGFHGLDKNAIDWVDSLGKKLHIRRKRSSVYDIDWNNGEGQCLEFEQQQQQQQQWRQLLKGWFRKIKKSSLISAFNMFNPFTLSKTSDLRKRKEIRTLSETERFEFFEAINALKQDTSQKPNKYDVLALLHKGPAVASAHEGPNFLGWHRYYLSMVEEALRTKNSHVTLPYWDSTLDFRMTDPKESILWTEMFFGNGIGVVSSGPFADWRTPANNTYLRRQLAGKPSSLVDPKKLRNVFMQRYHREITSPTPLTGKKEDNIEEHHNGVHRWVGGLDGHMAGLETSAMDPVFFLHHCYIDYLWEKFRERQSRLGINSETDYPAGLEQQCRKMDNLYPAMRSIAGYSDKFTSFIYRYADAPTCKNKCGGGFNGFLFCNTTTYKCESMSRTGFQKMGYFSNTHINYYTVLGLKEENAPRTAFLRSEDVPLTVNNPPPEMSGQFEVGIIDDRTA